MENLSAVNNVLADLVRWGGWDLVASLASAATLVWAILIARAQGVDARRRERAFVEALVAMMRYLYFSARDIDEIYNELIKGRTDEPATEADLASFRRLVGGDSRRFINSTLERLERVDLGRIPSTILVDRFLFVLAHGSHVQAGLKAYLEDGEPPSRASDDAPSLMEAVNSFRDAARRFGARSDWV